MSLVFILRANWLKGNVNQLCLYICLFEYMDVVCSLFELIKAEWHISMA